MSWLPTSRKWQSKSNTLPLRHYISTILILLAFFACSRDDKKYLRDLFFTYHEASMAVGDTMTVNVDYYPVGTNCGIPDVPVEWTVADTSIISISHSGTRSAIITGRKIGTTSITATLGGFSVSSLIIVEDEHIVSDHNFMTFCLKHFDTNSDGIIQGTEVCDIVGLDVSELSNICNELTPISFKGIEMFVNLRTFKATHLTISYLDLSKNPLLNEIDISQSEIAMLDVSNNNELRFIDCHACPSLTNIKFGTEGDGEYYLNTLNCRDCALTSIDLSRCIRLAHIDCSNNNLKELDLSNNMLIEQLSCTGNKISTIKVSQDFDMSLIKTLNIDEGVTFTRK